MKQTTKAKILAAIEAKKRAAKEETTNMVMNARQRAAETITKAQKEADVLIGNTTFRNIFFVHNNIIHDVKPNGLLTPFVPATFNTNIGDQYSKALAAYHQEMRNYRPFHIQLVTEKIGGIFPVTKPVRVPNPKPKPKPPQIPPDKSNKLNAAVADIIVDIHTQTMYWGRWAAPFRVFAMSLETKQVEVLYECEKPVTSVALGPEVAENADKKSRTIYWMEGNERIMQGSLHGQNSSSSQSQKREFLNITAPDRGGLWQMEVDPYNNRIYWTNDISIWRADIVANPASTSLMVISPSESSFPIDLAVDGYNGFLYWMDKDLKKVRKSDLEGVYIEDLYDIEKPTRGLKVDPNANLLYWSDEMEDGHALRRANTKNEVVRLDGKDDFIELPSIVPGDTFTIEMWINPDSTKDQQAFLGKHSKTGRNIFLVGYYQNNLIVNYNNVSKNISTDKITGHHHLAFVVSSANNKPRVTVYRNGKRLGKPVNFNGWVRSWGKEPWFVGKDVDPNAHNDFFDGGVSEVRIWSRNRSAEKIKADRYTRLQGNEPNLVGYWRADERQGELLPDLTGQGKYGMIFRENHLQPDLSLLTLDGRSHSIVLPEINQTFVDGLSIEFWVKFKKFNELNYILDFGNGQHVDNLMVIAWKEKTADKSNIGIFIRPFEGSPDWHVFEAWHSMKLNVWTHVAITLDPNGKVHIYKNGRHLSSSIEGSEVSLPRDVLRTQNFIGKSIGGGASQMLNGKLLDLRMWNRPLLEEEVFSRMHQRLSGNEADLWAYWPMNESKGELLVDKTPGSLDAQIADPKKKQREHFIALRQTLKNQKQKIVYLKEKHDELAKNNKLKKEVQTSINEREVEITERTSQMSVWNLEKEKLRKIIKPIMDQLKSLSAKRIHLINKHTQLQATLANLTVMVHQLKAMNIFRTMDTQIRDLNNKIKKVKSDIRKIDRDMRIVDKNMKGLNKKKATIDSEIQKLNKDIRNAELIISDIKKDLKSKLLFELDRLTRLIGDKKITHLKAELKTARDAAKTNQTEYDELSREFSETIENLWQPGFPPVNNTLIINHEPETIVGIPGLDGLELVHAEAYLKAKRKKAFDELHRTREKGAREKAEAEALAAKKIKEGERIKTQKEAEADRIKANALNAAARKKQIALSQKKTAKTKANAGKANAKRKQEAIIRKANSDATKQKQTAQRGANNKVAAARRRKNNAQTDVNRAKAERSDKIG